MQGMNLTIGHIVDCWLPPAGAYSAGLVRSMGGAGHEVFTTRTMDVELHPLDSLRVCQSEAEYGALAAWYDADVILAHGSNAGVTGLPVAQACGIPVVTLVHGGDTPEGPDDAEWLGRFGSLFRSGSYLVCLSDRASARLIAAGCPADRTVVVHPGVDTARYSLALRRRRHLASPFRLLSVAPVVTDAVDLEALLQAVRLVRDAGYDLSLRILGAGRGLERTAGIRESLALDGCVAFAGPADARTIRTELSNADVVVHASGALAAAGDADIPLALAQAMASHLPVVAVAERGVAELVLDGETGLLSSGGADDLAGAIQRLVGAPDYAGRLATAGRRRVEDEFSLRVQAGRVEQYLRDVAAAHQAQQPRGRYRRRGRQEAA
jgi:glycosyltransferase involved in cell wall biosynthesis